MSEVADPNQSAVHSLDLEAVVAAARRDNHWSEGEARRAEARYRDYLFVVVQCVQHGKANVAAISRSADQVWHHHVLWTRKYREDCLRIFGPGRFLDHIPLYAEPRTPADLEATRARYRELGLTPPEDLDDDCVWGCVG
ncbi:MAG TPA: hypothetical protein VKF59_12540 [Candidatus Dormibacteraeota bacterium]|nr:hypothetical protein [Candidatus Dormibacteraeota bacterium]